MSFIEFRNVSKSFGDHEVLRGLSLEIIQGETLTILGGSGTGKSVTLKLLLGLLPINSGQILFKGEDVAGMDEEALIKMRSKMGMLFQWAALFDSLTVFENVAYPLREYHRHSDLEIKKIVAQKLEMVGLDKTEEMFPADLSGGMKKRVGLARAIATDPEVLLYDEPTTGLDPANINRIDELILQMQKVLKVTSIVVTHDLASAFKVSNRLALLHNKKIEFVGTVEAIRGSHNSAVQDFIRGTVIET